MKTNWKETPLPQKLAAICSVFVALAVVVLAILQIFDVWPSAGDVYIPLMGVNLLLQAYSQWKTNRDIAIIDLCTAGLIFLCAAAVLLLP